MLTTHEKAEATRACRILAGLDPAGTSMVHCDTQPAWIVRDEAAVQAVIETLDGFQNPFHVTEGLVNVASGLVASKKVETDLLTAQQRGEAAFMKFVGD